MLLGRIRVVCQNLYLEHGSHTKAIDAEWIGGANSSASSGLGEFACGVLRTQIVLRWHLMGVHLIGMHLVGVYLIGVDLTGTHLMGVHLIGGHLTDMYLIGVYGPASQGVHLIGIKFMGMPLVGVRLIGMRLMSMHLVGVHASYGRGSHKHVPYIPLHGATPRAA